MTSVTPPKYVRKILFTLQSRGYLACMVGGCVRDMLLGRRPNDWDICTGALPEEVLAIFPGSLPTGIKHGTVTVKCGSHCAEVTTFRAEGSYADHRHPDAVRFVGDLTADLSRRDFTVNAMALTADGILHDPFGGSEDLKNGIIRCVGVPGQRFEEDALRMLRSLRFSARLGFRIEAATLAAIREKAPLAAALAPERIRDETEKLLLTDRPEMVADTVRLGLLDRFLLRPLPEEAEAAFLKKLPKKALVRWCALCALLVRHGCIASAESFLTALRLDNRTVRCCREAGELLALPVPESACQWKKQLNAFGTDTVSAAALCRDAMNGGHAHAALKRVLKSGECFSVKYLAVNGDDLLKLGIQGRELGDTLRFLLDYVMEYPDNNRRELLLALVSRGEEL